jgi:hypothetical protein
MQKQQRKKDVEDYNSVKTPRARGALYTEADDVLLGSSPSAGAAQQHGARRLLASMRRVLGRAVDRVTCTEDVPDGKDRTERCAAAWGTMSCRRSSTATSCCFRAPCMLYAWIADQSGAAEHWSIRMCYCSGQLAVDSCMPNAWHSTQVRVHGVGRSCTTQPPTAAAWLVRCFLQAVDPHIESRFSQF